MASASPGGRKPAAGAHAGCSGADYAPTPKLGVASRLFDDRTRRRGRHVGRAAVDDLGRDARRQDLSHALPHRALLLRAGCRRPLAKQPAHELGERAVGELLVLGGDVAEVALRAPLGVAQVAQHRRARAEKRLRRLAPRCVEDWPLRLEHGAEAAPRICVDGEVLAVHLLEDGSEGGELLRLVVERQHRHLVEEALAALLVVPHRLHGRLLGAHVREQRGERL
mmetsp:Transcript_49646/g.164464  ORF Transcript_49646/g.164464 Transcript_49646/m.164464 type:complete len:224 (-) Transcript_49646:669-1340(-)